MYEQFYEQLEDLGIVPVVVLEKVEDAAPLAHALMAAGMKSAEVTFRTACAAECIAAMAEAEPEMCVGAGTVLNCEQVDAARAAGAKFVVSPGFNADVVKYCIELDLPVLPGTVTPSEVTAAVNLGLKVTKFFPAAQYGGLNTIKALAAVFGGHRFMPTGGVSTGNVEEYLSDPAIIACGGTWMVKPALFADGDFSQGGADRPRGHGGRAQHPRVGPAWRSEGAATAAASPAGQLALFRRRRNPREVDCAFFCVDDRLPAPATTPSPELTGVVDDLPASAG